MPIELFTQRLDPELAEAFRRSWRRLEYRFRETDALRVGPSPEPVIGEQRA
jgi:hypothetical protein